MLDNLLKKLRLLTAPRKEPYLLLAKLGIAPKNITFYEVAFSHKSQAKRNDGKAVNNERLEYLGDGIIDAVAADILYHNYPNRNEGFLTNARAKLVQRDTLNKVAVSMGIDKVVQVALKNQTHNINIYGNALEALVGALFLDQGYDECRKFFNDQVVGKYVNLEKLMQVEQNFKSKLLEWCQKNKAALDFKLLSDKPDMAGNPVFRTMVMVNGIPAGSGEGYSKRESQQKASQKALAKLRSNKNHFLNSDVLKSDDATEVV
ncbi:MAG: ribonuclease III [Bacteroidales bacterium]|nr:ribonuclease III [Candidatus Physcocola equi]